MSALKPSPAQVMCADHLYTAPELLRMEGALLTALSFRLYGPTVWDFVKGYQEMLRCMLPPVDCGDAETRYR